MAQRTTPSDSSLDQFSHLPNEAGTRLPTVCGVLACSAATVWRLAKAGKIKAHKISPRVTVFNVGSIRALLGGGC
jgi:hypothetical protein